MEWEKEIMRVKSIIVFNNPLRGVYLVEKERYKNCERVHLLEYNKT